MTLSEDRLKELQAESMADDVAIDLAKLSVLSEADARAYFESGGKVLLAAPAVPDVSQEGGGDDKGAQVLALKKKGSDALKAGDHAAAIAAYREALSLAGKGHAEAAALQSNLSLVLLKSGDAHNSLDAADKCIDAKPDWHKAHYRKGDALFELRRFDDAVTAYGKAAVLAPSDTDVARALKLAKEAKAGGVWMRQLLPGRDIALTPTSQMEGLIFNSAKQMCASSRVLAIPLCLQLKSCSRLPSFHFLLLGKTSSTCWVTRPRASATSSTRAGTPRASPPTRPAAR